MYSAPYGYGNAAGQAFNGAPPGQSPQMQPGPGQNQPQQQMMYNQQFSMGPSVSGGYAGAQNPGAMMPGGGGGGGGPAGMMQNTAMPQMPANGQSEFIRFLSIASRPSVSHALTGQLPIYLACDPLYLLCPTSSPVPQPPSLPLAPAWPTTYLVLPRRRTLVSCLTRRRRQIFDRQSHD
jgi:hypothetical protein